MNTPSLPAAAYDHLQEVEFHPELLCPLLFQLWRAARANNRPATMRHQHLGGTDSGITLFVADYIPGGAVQVAFRDGAWVPAYQERTPGTPGSVTKAEPLDMTTKRNRPAIFKLFADIVRDLWGDA